MNKKNNIIVIILIILVVVGTTGGVILLNKKEKPKEPAKPTPAEPVPPEVLDVVLNNEFTMDMIKVVNSKEGDNYLISPYSIEIALNMLKEGAQNETFNQLDKVVSKRDIPTFSVKDRISVANGLFVKKSEKDNVRESYISTLKTSYKADVIFDKFDKPDKINDWVKEKTYGMIPKILDEMSKDFFLGIANAVAIDVEWYYPFECQYTMSDEFTKADGTKKNVEMMNATYESANVSYINNDSEKGIILPYSRYTANGEKDYEDKEDSTQLEFVAIMPTNTNVRNYINELTNDKLSTVLSSAKTIGNDQEMYLGLPRFKYDYNDQHFMEDLQDLGIENVFDPDLSDLGKMKIDTMKENLYVSQAIHMTHIDLNEKGTKAAAVTYFGVEKFTAMPKEKEKINIKFNKPFMYMIRDTRTKEVLFFGVVENPSEWKGSTCSEK